MIRWQTGDEIGGRGRLKQLLRVLEDQAEREGIPYGSVHVAPRPPRFDRCPECGAALEWAEESVQMPDGSERWTGYGAECSCGMKYDWAPNAPHLRQARRHEAAMAYQDEQRTEQLRVI